MTTLLNELERTGGRYGLQTMCEGGGQANVTIIERLWPRCRVASHSAASSSAGPQWTSTGVRPPTTARRRRVRRGAERRARSRLAVGAPDDRARASRRPATRLGRRAGTIPFLAAVEGNGSLGRLHVRIHDPSGTTCTSPGSTIGVHPDAPAPRTSAPRCSRPWSTAARSGGTHGLDRRLGRACPAAFAARHGLERRAWPRQPAAVPAELDSATCPACTTRPWRTPATNELVRLRAERRRRLAAWPR